MTTCRRAAAVFILLCAVSPLSAQTRAESALGTFLVTVNDPKGLNVRDAPDGAKTGALGYGRRVRAKPSHQRDWYEVFPEPGPETCPERTRCFAKAEFLSRVTDLDFEVFFPDLGEGDGALITVGDGDILIDGGLDPAVLQRYLAARRRPRGPIELLVITAPEPDHWLGLQAVAQLPIDELWQPGIQPCDRSDDYGAFLRAIDRNGSRTRHVHTTASPMRGPVFLRSVPEVSFTVLVSQGDPPGGGDCRRRADDAALVLLLQIGNARFFFASDAHGLMPKEIRDGAARYIEERLLQRYRCPRHAPCPPLQADVLKVPDHGAPTSSSERFRDAVRPAFAIISAQEGKFGPAYNEVVRHYEEIAQVLRTNARRGPRNDDIRCSGADGRVSCAYIDPRD